jgi:cytochrome b pre-mRNA-processing protein 3
LFGKARSHEVPQQIYGTVVAQARQPVFFTDYGFEDSVTGRFDVLALHLFLFSRRMVQEDSQVSSSLNQEVFDYFTADTDRALRELGVGDTSVPKRKKRMIHTFYAMVEDFSDALEKADADALLEKVIARFDGERQSALQHKALTSYIIETTAGFDASSMDDILKGNIRHPDPADFL